MKSLFDGKLKIFGKSLDFVFYYSMNLRQKLKLLWLLGISPWRKLFSSIYYVNFIGLNRKVWSSALRPTWIQEYDVDRVIECNKNKIFYLQIRLKPKKNISNIQ